jgi:ElaB/YqjD/DUF883 family membrane-anchored ribosome-binding protein
MDKKSQAISEDLSTLADNAQDLINATADVTGDKVANARKRLAAALENSKEIYGRVREKAIEGAKATDRAVHEHPYQALGVALGLGVLIGLLIGRRGRND